MDQFNIVRSRIENHSLRGLTHHQNEPLKASDSYACVTYKLCADPSTRCQRRLKTLS